MTQLRLTFRLQRDHAVAVIPPELPISRQTALVLSHYCVPTLPGQPQGLLLCGEEKYRVWIREWERVLACAAGRVPFLLYTRIEVRQNLRLRLPLSLLAYAGIRREALLTFRPDGIILLTAVQCEEKTP